MGDDGRRSRWLVLAKDGSVIFSKPKEVRPLDGEARMLLVRACIEYSATDRPDLFWSFDRLRDLIEHAPDDAYDVIRSSCAWRQVPMSWHRRCGAAGGPAVQLGRAVDRSARGGRPRRPEADGRVRESVEALHARRGLDPASPPRVRASAGCRHHGPIDRIGIGARRPHPWGMTARWSDPHRLPGPQACCDPGYARAVTEPDER